MQKSNGFGLRQSWRRMLRKGARAGGQNGSALFELAMVLPVLSMLLIGIIYGGMTFFNYVVLESAVQAGARVVATNRAVGSGPPTACDMGVSAVQSAAHYLKQSNLTITGPSFLSGAPCTQLVQYDTATISATYPCSLTIPFTGLNLCPLKGAAACGTGVASCIGATAVVSVE
jgi:Flp pilus assembly protein TadG